MRPGVTIAPADVLGPRSPGGRLPGGDEGGDPAVADDDVAWRVDSLGRVDHPAARQRRRSAEPSDVAPDPLVRGHLDDHALAVLVDLVPVLQAGLVASSGTS